MALNPCVAAILCGLSGAILNSLKSLIEVQIRFLQSQVAIAQAQLLQLDVAAIPLEIARNAANDILERARGVATLVPFGLIEGCIDLGDLNLDLVASLDFATAEFNDLVDELTQLLSYREEVAALVEELNELIGSFREIVLVIEACAQEAAAA